METLKKILVLIIWAILVISCEGYDDPFPQTCIYKFKGDYFNLIPVLMDESKSRFLSFYDSTEGPFIEPGTAGGCYIFKVDSGYIFDCKSCLKRNVGILDLPKSQWSDSIFFDSYLRRHLLDKDPYKEYWTMKSKYMHDSILLDGCWDTARINWILRNNLIEHYFDRIK